MVITRRSAAKASTADRLLEIQGENIKSRIAQIAKCNKKAKEDVPATTASKSSHITPGDTLESIGNYDLSMTSPSTGETPEKATKNSPLRLQKPNDIPYPSIEPFVPPPFRPLAPKPANSKGSANNPIVVIGDSPPSRASVATKRKRQTEPHKFMDRHSKLYTYRPTRAALALQPANGSTFTGHQSHDVYRMMNAKLASTGYEGNGVCIHGGGYGGQYPRVQYVAQQHGTFTHPHTQYHHHPPASVCPIPPHPLNQHFVSQPLSEVSLRQKAAQYVRDYTWISPHKRWTPKDAEQSSTSNPAEHMADKSPGHSNNSNLNIFSDNTANHLTHLTHQSTLLTQLFKCYPHSTDPADLRQDIRMLFLAQNQRLEAWLSKETEHESNHGNMSLVAGRGLKTTEEMQVQKLRDEEVRGFLSAGAGMWQDGSGLGVADVYAEVEVEETDGVELERGGLASSAVKGGSSSNSNSSSNEDLDCGIRGKIECRD